MQGNKGIEGDELTLEHYITKAMLLGMVYDPVDHTISATASVNDIQHDADTMEEFQFSENRYRQRKNRIKNRTLGPRFLHDMTIDDRVNMARRLRADHLQ